MFERFVRAVGNFFFLHIMGRWVAGAKAEDAVAYCRKLNSSCVINFLGEHYHEARLAKEAVAEYKHLIDLIAGGEADAAITIKPSQFGFNATDVKDPESFCDRNMEEVAAYASGKGITTWLDMESSAYTDFTLSFYKRNSSRLRLGICLQANLKRTPADLEGLIKSASPGASGLSGMVRLVKGIYKEKPSVSITDQKALHRKYLELIRRAFEGSPPDFGIAVGTHHPEAVAQALALQKKYRKRFFDLEVLKGVLPSYYGELRAKGVKVTEYVPYGPDSFAYSVRRALKNPDFAKSMLFSVFFDAYKKIYG